MGPRNGRNIQNTVEEHMLNFCLLLSLTLENVLDLGVWEREGDEETIESTSTAYTSEETLLQVSAIFKDGVKIRNRIELVREL